MSFAEDIRVIFERDPAAANLLEVLLTYPGLHALLLHRLAHAMHRRGVPVVPRLISHLSRWVTGIEIHPGATIGRRFFIDHGMGVVIGETAEIGDDVTLYQGVTLGGTSLSRGKRHPTLEDGVIVGAGAKVLGSFTVGRDARIGANAVVLTPVPAGASMVGIPAKPAGAAAEAKPSAHEFLPYGTPCDEIPDPVARALNGLADEVAALRARVGELEQQLEAALEPAPRQISARGAAR